MNKLSARGCCIVVVLYTVIASAGLLAAPAAAPDEDEENWQVPVTLGKDGWMTYYNPRFGCKLPVPPGMIPLRPPDNGDGQAFISADGKVKLIASGSFNVDHLGDVEVRWKNALAESGRKITYKRKTDGWYVISGVNTDGTGFYERYTADQTHCACWIMTYPQSQEKKFAAWIERIAKDYQARLGKGQDFMDKQVK